MCEVKRGVLLSTEYVSAKADLNVRCANGHEFPITADNLKHGRWCGVCKGQKQSKRYALNFRSVESLREFARQHHGGDCLATEPKPMLSKAWWKCSKDEHPAFPAVIAKVIHSGQWCPVCWQERREPPKPAIPYERIVEVVRERGGEIVEMSGGVWNGSKTRLTVRCPNRHEWTVEATNLLYAGSWCPECFNKGERIVRAIFEATFGGSFSKSKPDWLLSKRGRRLELDGYNEQQALAFEYQGPHHHLVEYVVKHDAIKREGCAKRGVKLIEVEAVKKPFPPQRVLEKVVDAFQRYGIGRVPVLPSGVFEVELEELRELAKTRGGELLSGIYLGSERHEWKCRFAEHPSWWAEPWRIRNGDWCPSCAGNRRLGLEGLRKWGNSVGLELLTPKYLGGTLAIYRWRCLKGGHVIGRTRTNILQSISRRAGPCPVCLQNRKSALRGRNQSS